VEDHIDRLAVLGTRVMINESWYKFVGEDRVHEGRVPAAAEDLAAARFRRALATAAKRLLMSLSAALGSVPPFCGGRMATLDCGLAGIEVYPSCWLARSGPLQRFWPRAFSAHSHPHRSRLEVKMIAM
jgi:hypothetical protein